MLKNCRCQNVSVIRWDQIQSRHISQLLVEEAAAEILITISIVVEMHFHADKLWEHLMALKFCFSILSEAYC